MNALPPSFPGPDVEGVSTVERRWIALNEAAGVVAVLAAAVPVTAAGMRDFPARIEAAGGWRLKRAEDELADLTAILEHGLGALLSINERGADPRPAARALLAEFEFACGALRALLPLQEEPVFAA
jgi:hypothetical protein